MVWEGDVVSGFANPAQPVAVPCYMSPDSSRGSVPTSGKGPGESPGLALTGHGWQAKINPLERRPPMECKHEEREFVYEVVTAYAISTFYQCLECGKLIEECEPVEQ